MTKRINYKRNEEFEVPLTQEEEIKYIKLLEKGDLSAREILITRNLRLVRYIALRFTGTGIEIEELESIGRIGLIKGIDKFCSDKKVKLATYVSVCVENEILLFLRSNTRRQQNEISMEKMLLTDQEGNDITLQEVLQDQSTDFSKIIEEIENMEDVQVILEYILNDLNNKNKLYILYNLAGYTQEEIGKKYQISQSYISRNLRAIKSTLKKRLEIKKKCNCNRYKVAIENKLYKISFTVEEAEKFKLCKDIISKTNYQSYYNNLKRRVLIIIDVENEALKLLAQIVECIEDIK